MANTTAADVLRSFEASFQDKRVLPIELELEWLLKAIARYSIEIEPLEYNEKKRQFEGQIERYTLDTLAAFMKQSYQEREVSKVNKRVSIVGKDISLDGNNGSKTAAKNELDYDSAKSEQMIANLKPTAYV